MPRLDENGLKEQIKSKNFSNVYMFFGEENYLKQFYVNKIKSLLVEPTFADFNYHQFEGKDSNIDEILRDAQMLPMMSSYNCVLVHDYPLDKSKEDMDALKEYFKDIPETTILIFWFDSIVVNVDDKKSSKWKTIENVFAKAGCSVNLGKRSDYDLAKLVVARAKNKGCSISMDLSKYFVSVVGNDLKTVYNEIDKICNNVSSGEIKKNHIDTLATKCLQAKVFDLSKYIIKGDNDASFDVLNSLLYNKEDPVAIISVITLCYTDMYRVKCAKSSNNDENDLANYFNTYKSRRFAIKNASRDCRNLSVEQLRNSIDILSDADIKLKSAVASDKSVCKLVLEQTVALLLSEVHHA